MQAPWQPLPQWPDTAPSLTEPRIEAQPQQYSIVEQAVNPIQETTRIGDGWLWLNEAREDSFVAGGEVDTMDLDADAIMTQDHWLDTSNGGPIDWEQWDAWLGNANPVRAK